MTSSAAAPAIAIAPSLMPGAVATSPAPQAPTADFLLMLGQLIGANAAPNAPSALIESAALEDASAEDETAMPAEAAEALVSGLAPLIPAPIAAAPVSASPPSPTPAVESSAPAIDDIVAELKLAREPVNREGASTLASAHALEAVNSQSAPAVDAPPTQIEALHMPTVSTTEPASMRAVAHDAAIARPVHAPVGSQQWADEIGSRITMMAEAGKQAASLRLSPEHLGPLEIRIAINDDQASVWFGAAHADTRAAIEHALPRLREMFEANGMSLADAGVHREAPGERGNIAPSALSTERPSEDEVRLPAAAVVRGLIDAYA